MALSRVIKLADALEVPCSRVLSSRSTKPAMETEYRLAWG